jgi:hypothetical protein
VAKFLVWFVMMAHYHETKFLVVRVGGPSVLTRRKAYVLQDAMATHEFIRVIVFRFCKMQWPPMSSLGLLFFGWLARQEASGVAYFAFSFSVR